MKKIKKFSIFIFISLFFIISFAQSLGSSPSWLDPRNTGRSPFSGPSDNDLKWMIEWTQLVDHDKIPPPFGGFGGGILGPEGMLFVEVEIPFVGLFGTKFVSVLYGFGADGKVEWTLEMDENLVPLDVSPQGTVYLGSEDNEVLALNLGKNIQWSCKVSGFPLIGSLTEEGLIYVWTSDNSLFAINPNGTIKWTYPTGCWIGKPSVNNRGVYFRSFLSSEDRLFALDLEGKLRWSRPIEGTGMAVIGDDGTLYVTSENSLKALDPSGEIRWSWKSDHELQSPVIAKDGTIYLMQLGKVCALSSQGILKWTKTFADKWVSLPVVDKKGWIYFCADNKFYSLNSSGEIEWFYDFGTPTISIGRPMITEDGTLYLVCSNKIFAFGAKAPFISFVLLGLGLLISASIGVILAIRIIVHRVRR